MNSSSPPSRRKQVAVTISQETHDALEQVSLNTGLSRSRLYDLALHKFVEWAKQVDPYYLRVMSATEGQNFGYSRPESGFRRAVQSQSPPDQQVYGTPPVPPAGIYGVPPSPPAPPFPTVHTSHKTTPKPAPKKAGGKAR